MNLVYELPAYALKSSGCCLQIAFCTGQSIATSSTVWNRTFLFACNELSQRYCEGEGEYSQCFGKTMALCVKVNVGAMLWR